MLEVQLNNFQAGHPLHDGLAAVLSDLPSHLTGHIQASHTQTPGLKVDMHPTGGTILFSRPCELFRGIGLIAGAMMRGETYQALSQTIPFETLGVMYDCSRNSVPTVSTIKKIAVKIALMGYNALLLYTEDTYTIKEQPAFGHYRGRYSPQELREIDDFTHALGIELIPCIQTLAHLERFLRWPCTREMQDTDHVLFSGNPKANAFINEMLSSITGYVRSRRIHLGLDEAHGLGLGQYLEKNGYQLPVHIMAAHLRHISDRCAHYGLRPMMWGDMLFRTNIEGGGYYNPDVSLPPESGLQIPREFDFIYWDYYHTEESFYLHYIEEHKKQGIFPLFAGGVASWAGMVPNLLRTAATTKSGVSAAKKHGLKEMFLCVWKDDGGESLPGPDYLGMLMYAENCYREDGATQEALAQNACIMTGAPYEAFLEVGSIDELLPGMSLTGLEPANPHKYFLWQDLFLGQFDCEAATDDFSHIYKQKAEALRRIMDANNYSPEAYYSLKLGYLLCRTLAFKVDLGIRLKSAYDLADKAALKMLHDEIAGPYTAYVRKLFHWHRKSWEHFYKPFGWEAADLKYGFLLLRAETACHRLNAYLAGTIDTLEELAHPRLTHQGLLPLNPPVLPHFNSFTKTALVSQLL